GGSAVCRATPRFRRRASRRQTVLAIVGNLQYIVAHAAEGNLQVNPGFDDVFDECGGDRTLSPAVYTQALAAGVLDDTPEMNKPSYGVVQQIKQMPRPAKTGGCAIA